MSKQINLRAENPQHIRDEMTKLSNERNNIALIVLESKDSMVYSQIKTFFEVEDPYRVSTA